MLEDSYGVLNCAAAAHTLVNIGANSITLVDESASSAAANRFALTANLVLAADEAAMLLNDATSSRWQHLMARFEAFLNA